VRKKEKGKRAGGEKTEKRLGTGTEVSRGKAS